jgi:hypothetical protein
MSKISSMTSCWDTASLGRPADVSPLERSALGEHLSQCGRQRGPLHSLRSGVGDLQGMLAGRVITSVLVLLLFMGGSWLML